MYGQAPKAAARRWVREAAGKRQETAQREGDKQYKCKTGEESVAKDMQDRRHETCETDDEQDKG